VARRLLIVRGRARVDQLPITRQFLAQMLGARR